jgi:hypothetical protein
MASFGSDELKIGKRKLNYQIIFSYQFFIALFVDVMVLIGPIGAEFAPVEISLEGHTKLCCFVFENQQQEKEAPS